jgi:hypothetical protein
VASSELENFSQPSSAAASLPNVAEVETFVLHASPIQTEPRTYLDEVVVATPQIGFSSSLWFRPPPAI